MESASCACAPSPRPFPQFPQMTIYDSLALANVSFGLYVNMTCGDRGDLPCSAVKPGWGTNTGNNQSTGLDPDVVMARAEQPQDLYFCASVCASFRS